jgi:hypothetical protein
LVPLPHVVEAPGADPTVTPAGNVSVSVIPVSGAASVPESPMVISSCATPFAVMETGVNACESVTLGAAVSITTAVAAAAFCSPPIVSASGAMLLETVPGAAVDAAVTWT